MYKKITSVSNPLIKSILSNTLSDDMFFVFGEKIIDEIIRFNYQINTLFILETEINKINRLKYIKNNNLILISKEVVKKLCTNRKEWIFAIFYKKIENNISNYKNAILLDKIQHPNNVGLIIRTALGLGVEHIILLNCTNRYNPKLISSSSSYCLNPKVREVKSLNEIDLSGKKLISTALSNNSKEIRDINKDEIGENWVLVFGNEGNGVSKEVLESSELIINIQMSNQVNSLNVAICASIVLWEILNKH